MRLLGGSAAAVETAPQVTAAAGAFMTAGSCARDVVSGGGFCGGVGIQGGNSRPGDFRVGVGRNTALDSYARVLVVVSSLSSLAGASIIKVCSAMAGHRLEDGYSSRIHLNQLSRDSL